MKETPFRPPQPRPPAARTPPRPLRLSAAPVSAAPPTARSDCSGAASGASGPLASRGGLLLSVGGSPADPARRSSLGSGSDQGTPEARRARSGGGGAMGPWRAGARERVTEGRGDGRALLGARTPPGAGFVVGAGPAAVRSCGPSAPPALSCRGWPGALRHRVEHAPRARPDACFDSLSPVCFGETSLLR